MINAARSQAVKERMATAHEAVDVYSQEHLVYQRQEEINLEKTKSGDSVLADSANFQLEIIQKNVARETVHTRTKVNSLGERKSSIHKGACPPSFQDDRCKGHTTDKRPTHKHAKTRAVRILLGEAVSRPSHRNAVPSHGF